MNRQRLILSVLLVVLAISAAISYFRMPKQNTVAVSKSPPTPVRAAADKKTAPATPVVDEKRLRVDLLECRQNGFTGFKRNIFKPVFVDETKKPPVLPKPVPPPPLPPPKPVAAPPPPPPEPPQVVRDMARFTFLGFLKKDNKKTIFLAKDKEIILVRQGDKVAGKYEATTITDEALSIRSVSDGSEMVIPLVENRPLAGQLK
ncbi:MAG: type II secretion system protein PulP [Desulfuromonadales bacterium]|nr:MAG: type II secretion system protein PulP [Desulfuromonadales bacterium]